MNGIKVQSSSNLCKFEKVLKNAQGYHQNKEPNTYLPSLFLSALSK